MIAFSELDVMFTNVVAMIYKMIGVSNWGVLYLDLISYKFLNGIIKGA